MWLESAVEATLVPREGNFFEFLFVEGDFATSSTVENLSLSGELNYFENFLVGKSIRVPYTHQIAYLSVLLEKTFLQQLMHCYLFLVPLHILQHLALITLLSWH
jgi:hypothetical protein